MPPTSKIIEQRRTGRKCQGGRGARTEPATLPIPDLRYATRRVPQQLSCSVRSIGCLMGNSHMRARTPIINPSSVRSLTPSTHRSPTSTTRRIIVPSATHRSTLCSLRLWQLCEIASISSRKRRQDGEPCGAFARSNDSARKENRQTGRDGQS
jgi:hypothetical protein